MTYSAAIFIVIILVGSISIISHVAAAVAPPLSIKVDMNGFAMSGFRLVGNKTTFALNNTDGHIHMTGTLINNGHLTVSAPLLISMSFYDNKSGNLVSSGSPDINLDKKINPGDTVNFNFDTGYTPKQAASQFPYLFALVNVT